MENAQPASTRMAQDSFELAVLRTELANRRTLLAFMKTSIGLFVSALGFLKFLDRGTVYEMIGIALIPIAFGVLIWGLVDYSRSRAVIRAEKMEALGGNAGKA